MTLPDQIWQFDLRKGSSFNPRDGACLLDAVSWLVYGTLGDHPACVCPVLAAFGRGVNDAMSNAGRQRLKNFILRLVDTVDPASEQARVEYLLWQAIHVFAPLTLNATGFLSEANQLRSGLQVAGAKAWVTAWASARAETTERAAEWVAETVGIAAWAAARAAQSTRSNVEDAMITSLDGVLKIGRQAKKMSPTQIEQANRLFAEAQS